MVGEPMFYPQHICMAKIDVRKGEAYLDLAEVVKLAQEHDYKLQVSAFGFRHGNEKMKILYQEHACIRPKNIEAVMADLQSDVDMYAQRLRLNETTFECGLCKDEKKFTSSMISSCGHVFCKECYLEWLKKSPLGNDCVCPNACPVPFKFHYTPYTFPEELTLRYKVQGNVKDLEAKEAAAAAAAEAAAAAAAAAPAPLSAARRPPPGHYGLGEWMMACGIRRDIAGRVMSLLIDTFSSTDVWTLLQIDIDSLNCPSWVKIELRAAAAALQEARDAGLMAPDGTLRSD
jgi:hypothetical protein